MPNTLIKGFLQGLPYAQNVENTCIGLWIIPNGMYKTAT